MLWLIIISLILIPFLLSPPPKQNNKFCDMHKWEYKKQPGDENTEYLQCSNCGFLPGHEDGTQL
jgi:hypothetical protein